MELTSFVQVWGGYGVFIFHDFCWDSYEKFFEFDGKFCSPIVGDELLFL